MNLYLIDVHIIFEMFSYLMDILLRKHMDVLFQLNYIQQIYKCRSIFPDLYTLFFYTILYFIRIKKISRRCQVLFTNMN